MHLRPCLVLFNISDLNFVKIAKLIINYLKTRLQRSLLRCQGDRKTARPEDIRVHGDVRRSTDICPHLEDGTSPRQ